MKPQRILIITMITLISLCFFTGCKEDIPVVTLSEVTLTPNIAFVSNAPITLTKEQQGFEIASTIIHDFDNYPPLSHTIYNDMTLSFTYDDGSVGSYILDLDPVGKHIYISTDTESRIVHDSISQSFFQSADFAFLMEVPVDMPVATIMGDDKSIDYICAPDLKYASYNGTELAYQTNVDCSESETSDFYDATENAHLTFDIDQSPDFIVQHIKNLDDQTEVTYPIEGEIIIPEEEGTFEMTITCTWEDDNEAIFYGDIDYVFTISTDLPPVVTISSEAITPGEVLVVKGDYLNTNQTMTVFSDIGDIETVYAMDHVAYGVIAVPCWYTPNNYELTVEIHEGDQLIDQQNITFDVVSKEFEVDHLYVTESTAAIRTDEHAASDQVHFDRARANPVPYPLFHGAFIEPTTYNRVSTEYGVIRVTNDDWENTRRHYGIDFANTLGTPIYATNDGIVTLSYELYITGNTIIIDHGLGLFSMYYHLDELLVEEGESVEKGELIANMGSTGYSTGSHLHFGIWNDGVYLNPWSFFEDGYLGIE